MLVGKTRRIELPHEPGQYIEIRDLSFLEIEKSKTRKLKDLMGMFSGVEMPDFKAPEGLDDREPDPMAGHDIAYLLAKGIVGWSYEEKVSPEAVAKLDRETAELVVREILGIEEDEARKKD